MDAVNEAVKLLIARRSRALSEVNALNAEVARIDTALTALGVDSGGELEHSASPQSPRGQVIPPGPEGTLAGLDFKEVQRPPDTMTMKEHVISVLESEPRPWTLDDLAEVIESRGGRGDRSDKQFRGTMRTALWTLRNEGRAQRVGSKANIATKYAPSPGVALAGEGSLSLDGNTVTNNQTSFSHPRDDAHLAEVSTS